MSKTRKVRVPSRKHLRNIESENRIELSLNNIGEQVDNNLTYFENLIKRAPTSNISALDDPFEIGPWQQQQQWLSILSKQTSESSKRPFSSNSHITNPKSVSFLGSTQQSIKLHNSVSSASIREEKFDQNSHNLARESKKTSNFQYLRPASSAARGSKMSLLFNSLMITTSQKAQDQRRVKNVSTQSTSQENDQATLAIVGLNPEENNQGIRKHFSAKNLEVFAEITNNSDSRPLLATELNETRSPEPQFLSLFQNKGIHSKIIRNATLHEIKSSKSSHSHALAQIGEKYDSGYSSICKIGPHEILIGNKISIYENENQKLIVRRIQTEEPENEEDLSYFKQSYISRPSSNIKQVRKDITLSLNVNEQANRFDSNRIGLSEMRATTPSKFFSSKYYSERILVHPKSELEIQESRTPVQLIGSDYLQNIANRESIKETLKVLRRIKHNTLSQISGNSQRTLVKINKFCKDSNHVDLKSQVRCKVEDLSSEKRINPKNSRIEGRRLVTEHPNPIENTGINQPVGNYEKTALMRDQNQTFKEEYGFEQSKEFPKSTPNSSSKSGIKFFIKKQPASQSKQIRQIAQ